MASSLREAFEHAHAGGVSATSGDAGSGPTPPTNFRIPDSGFDPPQKSNPLQNAPAPVTERGKCEACGEPFQSTRNAWSLRYSTVPAKRFCSERCRKRAEIARSRQQKGGGSAE
jgi:hypothetical protein